MNKAEELKLDLIRLFNAAMDLALSVEDDISVDCEISAETIRLLSTFKEKYDEMDTILDILTGIQ